MNAIELHIEAIRSEAPDAKTFVFSSPHPVDYTAGQFLSFLFWRNGQEVRRSYSISSAPAAGEPLSITLKRVSNGLISRWWIDEAKVGDAVQALPPTGLFTLPPAADVPKQVFLLAAGSGISPIYSLLKQALLSRPDVEIVLIYSNSSAEETIFRNELLHLQTQFPDILKVVWLFSNHPNLMEARLSPYILQHLLALHRKLPWTQVWANTCGPYDYMQMVRVNLFTMGLPAEHFRREVFDAVTLSSHVPRYFDETDRLITLHFQGLAHRLMVPYRQSILDAALKAGIDLPYSCRGGRCSTCRCKVLRGKVWMHYNEVLTDEDEQNGWALTCTGHPASDEVEIEIA
jgi:ferredoxin-NADP reductase